jgi:phosphopantothenoylcysteine decarboxylase / phosphopantothenate---cysteine ligase
MSIFTSKHIVLGVTGSIAAYKAADLASKLTQLGALVDVVLTGGAEKFVTPLTFQSVTGRPVFTYASLWGGEAHVLHVGIGHSADLLVIAPCTANTLSKLAHGTADNLLSVTALAANCPLLLAPAMDGDMFGHPATQENVRILEERDALIVGPAEGHLASGLVGVGRMVEIGEILGYIRLILGRRNALKGKKVVVTAGGTQEAIDPVRVITNRSSGKQGFALAQAAIDAGAHVSLIKTPTTSALVPPTGAKIINVGSAKEMLAAVLSECEDADILLMAAAVADFTVTQAAHDKLKKRDGIPQVNLELAPDILALVARMRVEKNHPKVTVGFAAESKDLLENASAKLAAKKLDFIAANDISAVDAGFGVDTNRVTLLHAGGKREELPLLGKIEVAEVIVARAAALLEN